MGHKGSDTTERLTHSEGVVKGACALGWLLFLSLDWPPDFLKLEFIEVDLYKMKGIIYNVYVYQC